MKDRKHVAWLYEELPTLVSRGLVPAETAERLRQHYGPVEKTEGRRLMVVLFGILGAVLIGGGVILLVAHNWDGLSRETRTVLAFIPLVGAIALAGWVLARRRDSTPWREGAATYWALTIGSTISLVARTYNISGDFGQFMLTWTLLGLPVIYLMRACLPAALYLVGITAWAGDAQLSHGQPAWFWVLAALLVPYLWRLFREDRYQPRLALVSWVWALCLCVATGFTLKWDHLGWWAGVYAGLLAAMCMAGVIWFGDAPDDWRRPLQMVGGVGVVVMSAVLTFKEQLRDLVRFQSHDFVKLMQADPVDFALWLALLLAAVGLCWLCVQQRRQSWVVVFGALPVVVGLAHLLVGWGAGVTVLLVLFNLYLAALGVTTMVVGLRMERLGIVNVGMGIIAVLIIARFFDSDLSFVVRGVAFIVVGAGFLTANVMMLRRKGVAR